MNNKTINILTLIVAIIVGFNAITDSIQKFITGAITFLNSIPSIIQLSLVILVFYLIFRKSK